jgi:DNA topoisomerase-1
MTNIERLQETGIRRLGKPGRFRFVSAGKTVNAADRKRIDQLRIPPAWSEVAISSSENGRIQAVGKDAAGRWQYLYHESHTRRQETRKFQRLIKFAEALPAMRATIRRHIKQTGLPRERVLASVLRTLSTCFMRPGSEVYASENGSYGIATLRRKHVSVKGDTVEFDFPGKSGVQQYRVLIDHDVAKVIRQMLKYPGAEVFKYQNGDGQFVDVKRRHINEYIKDVMGTNFSAKDFRTWAGTLVCACALAREGTDVTERRTARKRKVVNAIKETAKVLGNTPAVCRSSYICPAVVSAFERGKIIANHFETLEDFVSFRGHKLHAAETALLKFLKNSGN